MAQILPELYVYVLKKLGAKVGKNVKIYGMIFEPDLLEIGDDSIIGYDALILGHRRTHDKYIMGKIIIGKNYVIGARSVILPNVVIEDNSVIGAQSVVLSGTKVLPNTLYAGTPAVFKKELKTKKLDFN